MAHFLTKVLQRRLHLKAERQDLLPDSPWFDAEHAAVHQARRALVEALADHGHFPAAEWEAALRQAASQVTAYLVQPTATLVAFVFQDEKNPAPVPVVERRLGYFAGHAYLLDTARLYFQQKRVSEISRARFEELLRHIDGQLTREYDADAWLRLLAPLFHLAQHADPHTSGIPVPLLHAFFEDKGAEEVVRRLEAVHVQTGREALDEAALRRLLEPEAVPETEAPAASAPAASPPAADAAPQAVPLWKQYQQSPPPVQASDKPPQLASPLHAALTPPPEARPRWMQFREPPPASEATTPLRKAAAAASNAEKAPPAPKEPRPQALPRIPMDDLERIVLGEAGARNRDLFVRHLFDGSRDDYAAALHRLHAAPTWADATKVIAHDVFRKHQVNIYSDPAVLFTDTVEARYRES